MKGRKNFILKLILIFFCLGLNGCDFFSFSRYKNEKYGISLLLPRSWHKEEEFKNTVLLATAPEQHPKFKTNITLTVGDLTDIQARMNKKISLIEFFEVNKAQVMEILPGYKYNLQENKVAAGRHIGMALSFNNKIKEMDVDLNFLVGVWMEGSRVYTITCTTETERFPHYLPIFKKILQSLRIK